jgi:hypothetical protein
MSTTELIGALDAPDGVHPTRTSEPSIAAGRASESPFHGRPSAFELPAHDERLGALGPLIGAVAGEGPPIVLLAGPLVLFALALAGPFLLLLTLVALLVACAVLVALASAIVASPYLLVRRIRRHRLPREHQTAPAAQFVPVDSGR